MVNILAFAADLTRKLGRRQNIEDQNALLEVADELEGVAEKLVEIIFPQRPKNDAMRQRIEPM